MAPGIRGHERDNDTSSSIRSVGPASLLHPTQTHQTPPVVRLGIERRPQHILAWLPGGRSLGWEMSDGLTRSYHHPCPFLMTPGLSPSGGPCQAPLQFPVTHGERRQNSHHPPTGLHARPSHRGRNHGVGVGTWSHCPGSSSIGKTRRAKVTRASPPPTVTLEAWGSGGSGGPIGRGWSLVLCSPHLHGAEDSWAVDERGCQSPRPWGNLGCGHGGSNRPRNSSAEGLRSRRGGKERAGLLARVPPPDTA